MIDISYIFMFDLSSMQILVFILVNIILYMEILDCKFATIKFSRCMQLIADTTNRFLAMIFEYSPKIELCGIY